jgi:hypothetical protein
MFLYQKGLQPYSQLVDNSYGSEIGLPRLKFCIFNIGPE